jgi:hypothetical protein
VVGALVQTGLRLKASDVNGSNTVTSGDALLINRRFSGGITSFTVGNFANSNPSVTVGSSNMTQNMQAICFGDINGSYSPSTAARSTGLRLTDAGWMYSRSLEIATEQALSLGSVSLVLNIPAGVEVIGVQSKLNGGQLDYQVVGNQLRLGWYHVEGQLTEAGQTLVELQINANRDVKASEWSLGDETEMTDVWAQAHAGATLRIPSLKIGASALSVYPFATSVFRSFEC